ncbi:MAG: hypothetical protein NTNFB02_07620 [Nitrospira sp.]
MSEIVAETPHGPVDGFPTTVSWTACIEDGGGGGGVEPDAVYVTTLLLPDSLFFESKAVMKYDCVTTGVPTLKLVTFPNVVRMLPVDLLQVVPLHW